MSKLQPRTNQHEQKNIIWEWTAWICAAEIAGSGQSATSQAESPKRVYSPFKRNTTAEEIVDSGPFPALSSPVGYPENGNDPAV
jgi:hypothetical protein